MRKEKGEKMSEEGERKEEQTVQDNSTEFQALGICYLMLKA